MPTTLLWPDLTKKIHRTEYAAISPLNPANSHAGKTVVVTGGATGIGLAIARAFLRASARTVVLLARREEVLGEAAAELRKESGGKSAGHDKVLTYAVDITDEDRVNDVFAEVRQRINANNDDDDDDDVKPTEGKAATNHDIDVLVLSATYVAHDLPALGYSQQSLRATFETNVIGNLNAIRAFVPEAAHIPMADIYAGNMLTPLRPVRQTTTTTTAPTSTAPSSSPDDRVIINITDVASYTPFPTQSLYSASKLFFAHMIRHLDAELSQLSSSSSSSSPNRPVVVRAHSLHPAAVLTPASRAIGYDETTFDWDDESLPGGFAVWLASGRARFLRGRFVHATWDVDELVGMEGRFAEDGDLAAVVLKV
ncbi:hypothetical protein SLS54_007839 [Diplodia seriata]